jgi:hypothetical protein
MRGQDFAFPRRDGGEGREVELTDILGEGHLFGYVGEKGVSPRASRPRKRKSENDLELTLTHQQYSTPVSSSTTGHMMPNRGSGNLCFSPLLMLLPTKRTMAHDLRSSMALMKEEKVREEEEAEETGRM